LAIKWLAKKLLKGKQLLSMA